MTCAQPIYPKRTVSAHKQSEEIFYSLFPFPSLWICCVPYPHGTFPGLPATGGVRPPEWAVRPSSPFLSWDECPASLGLVCKAWGGGPRSRHTGPESPCFSHAPASRPWPLGHRGESPRSLGLPGSCCTRLVGSGSQGKSYPQSKSDGDSGPRRPREPGLGAAPMPGHV